MFGLLRQTSRLVANKGVTKSFVRHESIRLLAYPIPIRHRVPKEEVLLLCGVMIFCWTFTPIYILLHLKEYTKSKD